MKRWLSTGLALALFLPLSAGAGEPGARDRWFIISLGGAKVGYYHQLTRADGDDPALVRTTDEMTIVLNRLGSKVTMSSTSDSRESGKGELQSLVSELSFSSQTVRTEAAIARGEVVVTTSSGGSPFVKRLPFSGVLLGPEGIRALSRGGLAKEKDTISFQSYSTEVNRVMSGTRTVVGRETLEAAGKRMPVLKVVERYAEYPVESTVWLDAEGDQVRSSAVSPFGEMSFVLASREEALDLAGAGRIPEEQYARTLVRSNVRLPQARLIESLTLAIRRTTGAGQVWPSFAGSGQTVLEEIPGRIVLRIDRPDRRGRGTANADAADLSANVYLDTSDALVQKTVREIVGSEKDPFRRADLLKNGTAARMTFDLGLAFAPSSEVIRNLRGTCAEYAILLATLARASGIPSRYLMGLVYLNGIWGGHAWTEMLIDGTWVQMDAAVNGPGAADAARFYFAESSLDAGPGDSLAAAQQFFGSIAIDVLEYRLNGKTVRLELGAPLYTADGDRYMNPGLGLSVRAPGGFSFSDMDKVWPDKTVVVMRSPDGRSARILQEAWPPDKDPKAWAATLLDSYVKGGKETAAGVRGYDASSSDAANRSAAVFRNGVDIWVVLAEGRNAAALLDEVLASLAVDPYGGPTSEK
ncbi:MAG TPA: transglutaminase-like domain-containing protein [Acidobacteriota bacterium]|nr:transglutaminase-like domain-containing protein [Acidobacteriota bacterium]